MSKSPPRPKLRKSRSYSLDAEVIAEVERTKAGASAGERVNQLLRYALKMEREASLAEEAAEFFANEPHNRPERRAFQKWHSRTWTR